ncbi:unnamed protein product [Rhizoctonia solani]|uniref:HhH-GPD domain-containing protein n=1 Tax=Rhizoctonia solani TaxID=456999 RepID=A0A8H3H7P8_9AGAM|nr:unnamed protein product [Rhizoctonia solani]
MPPKRAASNTPLKHERDSPILRRSARKRARVEPATVEDDESELTELDEQDEDEYKQEEEEEKPNPLSLDKFAYSGSASRPKRTPAKVQVKLEDMDDIKLHKASSSKKGSAAVKKEPGSSSPTKKKPPKQKPIVMELAKPHPAPPNWEKQYALIEEMRANIDAPVDTMGCAKSMTGVGPLKDQRFGTLVSLMLSSQTKDEVTTAAVENLRRVLPGGLTVDSIIAAEPSVISDAIGKVGFWRRKTEYLQAAAMILREKHDSDVPQTVDELNVGIGVDIHVHRITNRLGWHKPPTNTPEQTRLNLQSWLPRNLHAPINPLLVGFGQVICLPVGPRCDSCSLSQGLCPSANAKATGKGKKPITYKVKADLDADGLVRLEDVKLEGAQDVKLEQGVVELTNETKAKGRDVGEPLVQIKLEE